MSEFRVKRGVKGKPIQPRGLSETQEAIDLARWLERQGHVFTHVPMGGPRDGRSGAILAAMGARRGVPDFLVFTPPPPNTVGILPDGHGGTLRERARGVAVELKRARGGDVSASQRVWTERLEACGWCVIHAHGAKDAILQLSVLFGQ